MQQMAPMNWFILFIMFTMIFIQFNCMNYYSFKYQNKIYHLSKNIKKLNWKW